MLTQVGHPVNDGCNGPVCGPAWRNGRERFSDRGNFAAQGKVPHFTRLFNIYVYLCFMLWGTAASQRLLTTMTPCKSACRPNVPRSSSLAFRRVRTTHLCKQYKRTYATDIAGHAAVDAQTQKIKKRLRAVSREIQAVEDGLNSVQAEAGAGDADDERLDDCLQHSGQRQGDLQRATMLERLSALRAKQTQLQVGCA